MTRQAALVAEVAALLGASPPVLSAEAGGTSVDPAGTEKTVRAIGAEVKPAKRLESFAPERHPAFLALSPDADLEPGFPVQIYGAAGTYHAGPRTENRFGTQKQTLSPRLCYVVTHMTAVPT